MKKILGLLILGIVFSHEVWAQSVIVYNASGSIVGTYDTVQAGVNACPIGGTVSVSA